MLPLAFVLLWRSNVRMTKMLSVVLSLGALTQAQTVNLRGKVTNSSGQGISGAIVTLVGQDLKDTTDASGAYAITRTPSAVSPGSSLQDNIKFNRGAMELHLAAPASVKIEIFDLMANLLKEKAFGEVPAGEFRWNMNDDFGAANLLVVRATIGGRVSTFHYSPLLSRTYYLKSSAEPRNALARTSATAAVGSLEFKATGYATKVVDISTYDETVNVSLGSVDRWGGLNNPPVKSAGCGKALGVISKSGTYQISSAGGRGSYIINMPSGYDKDTPYRLIFGNHCMGGSAIKVAGTDNGLDQSAHFYHIKTQADKDNVKAIYVALQGDGSGGWSAPNDLTFWNDVLTLVEKNLCVDTTRVFVAGFSFGAMFSYALSLQYPEKIRAVATYAPANWNFYQPTNRKIPIAYYQTTGTSDGTCKWINNDAQKTGGKYCLLQHAQDNGCNANVEIKLATGGTHVTTEFTGCKEGYPVKFSSFKGGHDCRAYDQGSNTNWIEVETWAFFKQF